MEIVHKNRKIRGTHQPVTRCSRIKKTEKKKRTSRKHPNDFLRQQFPPVAAHHIPKNSVIKLIESGFINSINNLSKLYGFKPKLRVSENYPFSITQLYNLALEEMQKRSVNVELVILQERNEYPVIATIKEINIGLTLYYVPLDALWQLHLKGKKETFNLLLSIYSYLYHIARMPLLNDDSYLHGTYDMMRQQYEDHDGEFEPEQIRETMQSFTKLRRVAPILNNEIANTGNLYDFTFRFDQFEPEDNFEKSLFSLAEKLLRLWRDFPNESFTSNNAAEFLYPDEEEIAYSDQFFSFCWAFDGWMMDQLLEWVNCDLQEKSVFELPFSIQKFDIEHTEILHEFSYQKQLLELLNELTNTLNQLYE